MQTPETTKLDQSQDNKTRMTTPSKKVKVKLLRGVWIPEMKKDAEGNLVDMGRVAQPGEVIEVDEQRAKEICDDKFTGNYAFSGDRYEADGPDSVKRHEIVRGVRV